MTIDDFYKQNVGYWSLYAKDVFLSSLIIACAASVVCFSAYKTVILQVRNNWNMNKCSPIYMPFAGYIMPQPGKTSSESTVENFNYCLKKDVSMVFGVAMLPFEFSLYMIIEMMDVILNSILAFMAFLAWLKAQLGGIFALIYSTILAFLIPLTEIMIKMRDSLAKVNGILLSSVFTTMTIYNITISGLLNVMHIINVLMIALGAVIVAMLIVAFILMINPFTIVFGLPIYITATLVLVMIILPTIVIYIMMLVFMVEMTKTVADKAPSTPSAKK